MAKLSLSSSVRKEIGMKVRDYILAGDSQKGDLPSGIWRAVEAFHRNESPGDPGGSLIPIHKPLSQPRQDALTAQVCTVLGRQEPYMLAECVSDPDAVDALQKLVHRLWQQAGFELQIRKASSIASDTNKGILRISPRMSEAASGGQGAGNSALGKPGVAISVIHPKDFVIYPATTDGITGATLSGHRFFRKIATVKDMIASGRYYQTEITGGEGPQSSDVTGALEYARTSLANMGSDQDQQVVELWECIVRLALDGGVRKAYRAVVATSNSELLDLEEYPYARPWYFEQFYIADESEFWSGKSVGRNLYSTQDYYNKLASLIFTGGAKASSPVVIGPKLSEKYTSWKASDYIESDEPVQPWSPSIRFDVGPLIEEMQGCERLADQIARVSQNTLGANNTSAQTATENSIIASGVAVGIEEFIANFSSSFPAMAEHTIEIAKGMYGELLDAFQKREARPDGTFATIGDMPKPEWLDLPAVWEVAGKSPSNTPQAKVQSALTLMNMAQNPASGFDIYELGNAILKNSALSGTDGIQKPRDQVQQGQQQMSQIQALGQAMQSLQQQVQQLEQNAQTPGSTSGQQPIDSQMGPGPGGPPTGPVPPDGTGAIAGPMRGPQPNEPPM